MYRAALLVVFLSACSINPHDPGACSASGVREIGQPMAETVLERPVSPKEVHEICPSGDGCVLTKDGIAYAYYPKGDGCLRIHEICHAIHGPYHTVQYTQKLIDQTPRPSCPYGN